MSDTINLGIDLGTTNSAIAVAEGANVSVIKNNDGWDITPSAVWMPKSDVVHVGRRAYERVETDGDNAAAEFKLEMGQADSHRNFDRAGVSLTPQELSAEVLKSLRGDAAHHLGYAPDAAVITVPAAFALNQNRATTEAATLAGLDAACPLVQEPTAAATAYGVHRADDRGYWMVFDFGGGTFDAAVVSKHDEDLRIINHMGDPYLGGKLIDWAVVERVLAPEVVRTIGWEGFARDNPDWKVAFGQLKHRAEEAKIVLSRREQADITVDLLDADGNPEPFEYTLRRDELDALAEPYYNRAINLCNKALAEASLGPDDIDRLLLVGGVTLAPGLRERLADPSHGPGIQLDWSLDPTVVVARGAAIVGSSVRRPQRAPAAIAPGEFAVELAYEPRVSTTRPSVGGRVKSSSTVDLTAYSVTLSNPEGQPPFHSGRLPLNAKGTFMTDVEIDAHTSSTFRIELIDQAGAPCPLTPDSVTITHGVVTGGVKLAHSLGIQLVDRAFAPMLRKGDTLPKKKHQPFKTSGVLHRGDAESVVQIPVVQGERARGDRNRQVGMLQIQPKDVRFDLPAGTQVEVTFEVDESNLVTVFADVPMADVQVELEAHLDDVAPADPGDLERQLEEATNRLRELRESAARSGSNAAGTRLDRLDRLEQENAVETVRDQVTASRVDGGAAATAEERLRDLQAELDDVQDAVELPELIGRLNQALAEAEELVGQVGQASDRQELADLRSRAEEAIRSGDSTAVRKQLDRAGTFLAELERRLPDFGVRLFYTLQDMLPPSPQRDALIAEGNRAIASNDPRALDAVNQRMIRLLPIEEQRDMLGLEQM